MDSLSSPRWIPPELDDIKASRLAVWRFLTRRKKGPTRVDRGGRPSGSPVRTLTASHVRGSLAHLAGSILLHSRRGLSPKDGQLYKRDARCLKHVRRNRTGASSRPRSRCVSIIRSYVDKYLSISGSRLKRCSRGRARGTRKDTVVHVTWREPSGEASTRLLDRRNHEVREKSGPSGNNRAGRDRLVAEACPRGR